MLELLVTMVIMAMVIGIYGQATWQLYKIEIMLSESGMESQLEYIRREWIRLALAGLQPINGSGRAGFEGNGISLKGITGSPILAGVGGFGEISLDLRFDPDSGKTKLFTKIPGLSSPTALLTWQNDKVRFRYVDSDGQFQDQWPPAAGIKKPLPSMIIVESPDGEVLVANLLIAESVLPSRTDIEKM